jgi:tRNA A37 threonylcarbamoyladenosine biosynthesis protein TsaE
VPIVHVDFYRLGPEQADGLEIELVDFYEEGRHVFLVEWAEYAAFIQGWKTLSLNFTVDQETQTIRTLYCQPFRPGFDFSDFFTQANRIEKKEV